MEQNNSPMLTNWTQRELDLIKETDEKGAKPVAPSLAASLYNLFLEGYSCLEISKQGKGLSEGDILYLRRRYNWDQQKEQYFIDLQMQVQSRLMKSKMEAVEFLTSQMSVIHKAHKDQILKYLMTGHPDDIPKDIGKLGGYKQIIEVLQKVTGEDKVQKVNINQKTEANLNVNVNANREAEIIDEILKPVNAAKALSRLANDSENK